MVVGALAYASMAHLPELGVYRLEWVKKLSLLSTR